MAKPTEKKTNKNYYYVIWVLDMNQPTMPGLTKIWNFLIGT